MADPTLEQPFTDRWDVAELRAERDRYRAALEEIARDVFSDRSLSAMKCAYIARDALEQGQ